MLVFVGYRYIKLVIFLIVCLLLWQAFKLYPGLGGFSQKPPVHNVLENGQITAPVSVEIYYEALCPDSRSFILKQLVPTYKQASRLMDVKLIPYGKAETKIVDGEYIFECQHSTVECMANKIHACVIDQVTDVSVQIKYVACMIADNSNPDEAGQRCAKELSIDYNPIGACAKNDKGSRLLKKHGDSTHALNPKVHFIPTIVLDYSQEVSSLPAILKDLFKQICNQFIKSTPVECQTLQI